MKWIDYRDFPNIGGFSKLFIDYITDYQKVHKYFEYDFNSIDSFRDRCKKIDSNYTQRENIVRILLRQNTQFGCSHNTILNIEKLAHEKTYAIVTGQQVGVIGGPLYTIIKIISLLKLVEHLNTVLPNNNFVPVFWLEGEDHDFEEVSQIKVVNAQNKIEKLQLELDEKFYKHRPAGQVIPGEAVEIFKDKLFNSLLNTEFKNNIFELINATYDNENNLEKSFIKFIERLFPQSGIIFISSNDKEIKDILSPIFVQEFETFPKTSQTVIQQSAELENNYHAQIKPRAFNLFYFYKGGRYLIEPRENDFSLKGTRKFLSREEMLKTAAETPELLSPNVILRPICQDFLLPTAAYISGPSEIAYFAQLKSIYNEFNVSIPIIYPRPTITILENKVNSILEKYELKFQDVLAGEDFIKKHIINFVSEVNIEELFEEIYSKIEKDLKELNFGLSYIDQTLLGALDTTKNRIKLALDSLKDKTLNSQNRKHEIALRQIEKVLNYLLPDGNLQERELNYLTFLNKYGPEFQDMLFREIKTDKFMHHIIELD